MKNICSKCDNYRDLSLYKGKYYCSDCLAEMLILKDVELKRELNIKETGLNLLSKKCYKIAENNGFFDFEKDIFDKFDFTDKEINHLRLVFLSQTIAHATSEHSELYEALRNGNNANIGKFIKFDLKDDDKFYMAFKELIKNTIQAEICDSIIIMLGLAYKIGIDLNNNIEWNLRFNELRLKKEGVCNGKRF